MYRTKLWRKSSQRTPPQRDAINLWYCYHININSSNHHMNCLLLWVRHPSTRCLVCVASSVFLNAITTDRTAEAQQQTTVTEYINQPLERITLFHIAYISTFHTRHIYILYLYLGHTYIRYGYCTIHTTWRASLRAAYTVLACSTKTSQPVGDAPRCGF